MKTWRQSERAIGNMLHEAAAYGLIAKKKRKKPSELRRQTEKRESQVEKRRAERGD